MRSLVPALSIATLIAAPLGCGDSGGRDSESLNPTFEQTTAPVTESAGSETEGTTSSSGGTGTATMTGTTVGPTEPTTSATLTDSDSDSDSNTDTMGSATDSDSESGTDTDGCVDMGGGQLDFSYIWVANSAEGTVSKINTVSMQEEARYTVRPDAAGNPSRTSVNLRGDVAIANRAGGVAKIYARHDDCTDLNGNGAIDTSTGKFDVRAWGEEECLAWYTDFPQYNVMRPMAWSPGEFNQDTCQLENQKAWTTGAVSGQAGSAAALMLNGETGAVEATIAVPELQSIGAGPYGGAVDADSNFWFHSRDAAPYPLVRVDAQTLEYQIWTIPPPINPYGITIDTAGRVWIAGYQGGSGRFDPETETWEVLDGITGLGIQEDADNRMWIAIYPWNGTIGAWGIDAESMQQVGVIDLTGSADSSRGLSIDYAGNVWIVEQGSRAFRVDVNDNSWEVYDGLTGAYTYSDMTGWGLKNIIPG